MKKLIVNVVLCASLMLVSEAQFSYRGQQVNQSITGLVVYPDGTPAPGATVLRYRSDNPTGLQSGTESQADGSFIINNLEPGVSYSLCASKREEGYLDPFFLPYGLPVGGNCKNVVLSAGSNPVKVRLQLSKKAGKLEGRILNVRTQRPIVSGKVTLYRPLKLEGDTWILVNPKQATWIPSADEKTDAAGDFSFSKLPEGRYFLRVKATGYPDWFFDNQSSEAAAQPLLIRSGRATKVVASLQLSSR